MYKLLDSYKLHGPKEEQFVERLLQWAENVRKMHRDGAISEVITTRRLVHIIRSYRMFGKDRKKAIQRCIARFDLDIKSAFLDYYKAIDENMNEKEAEERRIATAKAKGEDPETPF